MRRPRLAHHLIRRWRSLPPRTIRLRLTAIYAGLFLACGEIQLDTIHRVATHGGRRLDLSPKELTVLELLLTAAGQPLTTEELLRGGWDEYADAFSSVVKVTINRLRRKLGDPGAIETVPRAGYRMRA